MGPRAYRFPHRTPPTAKATIYLASDDDIHQLIERLNACRAPGSTILVTLLHVSGAGISLLVRADVFPALPTGRICG